MVTDGYIPRGVEKKSEDIFSKFLHVPRVNQTRMTHFSLSINHNNRARVAVGSTFIINSTCNLCVLQIIIYIVAYVSLV